VLDQGLEGCGNQTVVMVTHLPVAGGDAVPVPPAFRCDGVVARTLLAAAAAAATSGGGGGGCCGGVAVRASRTGSAVLSGAVRLRRGVRVL